jgi:hypothetical protein
LDHLTAELEHLVRQTNDLWDTGWVSFNWRAYTYDHVQRVRGLSVTLCREEGGDELVTELAALLHDLTKPYDGEYLTDGAGQRLVDEQGYWRSDVRSPARSNQVTALYDRLGLAGAVHHESGAVLAAHLLAERAVDPAVSEAVALTIRQHLGPPADAAIPSQCLYDADTIDANIGLPAFVRNIYINQHFYDLRRPAESPTLADLLASDPLAYLRPYVLDKLPFWLQGKQRDFVPRLMTAAARRLANERLERLARALDVMQAELGAFGQNGARSSLDVILHYMRPQEDPRLAEETAYLANHWLPPATPETTLCLIDGIQREMQGAC